MPNRADYHVARLFEVRSQLQQATDPAVALPDLAKRAGISPYHFLRLYRSVFGETPHRDVVRFRMSRAKQLLVETDLPITQICFESGYESLGTFSRRFRDVVGCAPSEFRARRRRFWPVNLEPIRPLVPFCLFDIFRG